MMTDAMNLAMKAGAVVIVLCMAAISNLDYVAAGDSLAGHAVVWCLIATMALAAASGPIWRSPRPTGMVMAALRLIQVVSTAAAALDCALAAVAILERKPLPAVLAPALFISVPLFLASFVLAAFVRQTSPR